MPAHMTARDLPEAHPKRKKSRSMRKSKRG